MQTQKTCPECKGRGKSYSEVCDECRGKGVVEKTKTLTVTIPEGVDEGFQLRLSGKGNAGVKVEQVVMYSSNLKLKNIHYLSEMEQISILKFQ